MGHRTDTWHQSLLVRLFAFSLTAAMVLVIVIWYVIWMLTDIQRSRTMKVLAVVFGLMLTTPLAAQSKRGNFQLTNAVMRQPTPMHRVIYTAMEECSHTRGDFSRVNWWVADWIRDVDTNKPVWAFWSETGTMGTDAVPNIIVLTRRYANNPTLLSHEILHDIYRGQAPGDVMEQCTIRLTGFPPGG